MHVDCRTDCSVEHSQQAHLCLDAPFCVWPECLNPAEIGAICFVHAYQVSRQLDALLAPPIERPAPPKLHVVYYLTLSPTTVKIGTTGDLLGRIKGLRSDIQYVLAVEPGSHDIERQRHHQFAPDRIGRREDFRASEQLQHHIRQLQIDPQSEELLTMYRERARR